MQKFTSFYKKTALGTAVLATALILLTYGCSKGEKPKAEAPKQEATVSQPALPATQAQSKEHFDKGVQFSLKGQYDEAIKEYDAAIQSDPKNAEAYNNIGFAYMDKGKLDKAIESQKKALEINPHLGNAHFGLAMALEKKGDKQNALLSWQEFLKYAQPHSKWWLNAQEHIKRLQGKTK